MLRRKSFCRGLLATYQHLVNPEHADALVVAQRLGVSSRTSARTAEAAFRDTLERMQREFGPDHHDALCTARALAAVLQDQQKCDEAEPLLRDTLATQQRVLGTGTSAPSMRAGTWPRCSTTQADTGKPKSLRGVQASRTKLKGLAIMFFYD